MKLASHGYGPKMVSTDIFSAENLKTNIKTCKMCYTLIILHFYLFLFLLFLISYKMLQVQSQIRSTNELDFK